MTEAGGYYLPRAFQEVHFVSEKDGGYARYLRTFERRDIRQREQQDMGEITGSLVERAVTSWLGAQIPLARERILRYTDAAGKVRYQELDAVWKPAYDAVCLYEIKLTTQRRIREGKGRDQLKEAAEILAQSPFYSRIYRRVLYVTDTPEALCIPTVSPFDLKWQIGVVWVGTQEVEASARRLGLELPFGWNDPAQRKQSYLQSQNAAIRELISEVNVRQNHEPLNPMAEAFARAMGAGG